VSALESCALGLDQVELIALAPQKTRTSWSRPHVTHSNFSTRVLFCLHRCKDEIYYSSTISLVLFLSTCCTPRSVPSLGSVRLHGAKQRPSVAGQSLVHCGADEMTWHSGQTQPPLLVFIATDHFSLRHPSITYLCVHILHVSKNGSR